MATEKQFEALRGYSEIMREVSQRLWWLDRILTGKTGMSALLVRDSGFLQVRMICELIAYGCLMVHGDIEETQTPKLQKEYQADKIMRQLAKLHPDFFPQAHVKIAVGPGRWHFEMMERALNQREFGEFYGRCGDALHRGSLAKIIAERGTLALDLTSLNAAAETVKRTICCHSIALLDGGTRFLCDLTPTIKGAVNIVIGEAQR